MTSPVSECVPNLSEFTGNQANKGMLEMHAKFTLGQQIARADGLSACVPKCVQIIHTLVPEGLVATFRPLQILVSWFCRFFLAHLDGRFGRI